MEDQKPRDVGVRPLDVMNAGEYAYLIGAPPIEEFLGFIKTRAEEDRTDLGQLSDAWRAAARCRGEIEASEAGFADGAEVLPLPPRLRALAEHELQDPGARRSLERLPSYWALVDLDQLVVHQRCIDLEFMGHLAARLPECPTEEQIFHFAAGLTPDPPNILVTRSEHVFTFASPSSDLRILETTLLDPRSIAGYHAPGRAAHVVAVAVGYGVNFASAFRIQGRLLLHNATHRAAMLHGRGIRKMPCLVREVSSEEDLALIGATDVRQSLHLYLRSRRPPRLSDFFDPRLRVIVKVPFATRLAHVQVSTQLSRARTAPRGFGRHTAE